MSARQFEIELTAEWAAKVDDIAEAVAGIGLLALTGIVRKSPVDTGRFRGNWITSVGGVSGATFDRVDPSGSLSINEGAGSLMGYPNTMPTIYLQNNLPYANRLENGWSRQAPGGMVALTVAEIEAQMNGREV